jgi:hypothetical protein
LNGSKPVELIFKRGYLVGIERMFREEKGRSVKNIAYNIIGTALL